jgi:hypothetical protein
VYTLVVVHDGFVIYGWRRVFDFCAPEYCTKKRSVPWYENNNACVWIILALCLADKRPTLHRRGGCSEEIESVGAGMAVTPCVMISKITSFLCLRGRTLDGNITLADIPCLDRDIAWNLPRVRSVFDNLEFVWWDVLRRYRGVAVW